MKTTRTNYKIKFGKVTSTASKPKSLKAIVFDLMNKRQKGVVFNFDQEVFNEYQKDFSFQTVENYKQQWKRNFLLTNESISQ